MKKNIFLLKHKYSYKSRSRLFSLGLGCLFAALMMYSGSICSVTSFAAGAYDFSKHVVAGPGVQADIHDDAEAEKIDARYLRVLELVNDERAENGISPVSWSETAANAAVKRAVECSSFFDHTRPDGRAFYTAFDDIKAPAYSAVGENLAIGYSSPDEVVNAWMASPGHRANILNNRFDTMGVSSTNAPNGIVWVQEFYTAR